MAVKDKVLELLNNNLQICRGCSEAPGLAQSINEMLLRLEKPLRVAVVGMMKAGKSTFLNALMKKNILFTGRRETTFTVCHFKYAPKPFLTVKFRDKTEITEPFEALEKWSVREFEKENPNIKNVRCLVINYPAEVLKTIEFIDTPGLNSVYGLDSQNSLEFLAIKETIEEASEADAVIYAFRHTAGGFDKEILEKFLEGEAQNISPINSVGILTKADATGIWQICPDNPNDEKTPVEAAAEVTNKIIENAYMKKLLFAVLPVCAKAYEGCLLLSQSDWQTLQRLSALNRESLQDLLFDAEQFKTGSDQELNRVGSENDRARLIDLLDPYGILEIATLLKGGKTPQEIPEALQERCGISEVRRLITRHFASRAFLIKAQYVFNFLRKKTRAIIKNKNSSSMLCSLATQLNNDISRLLASVQALNELGVLRLFYAGKLELSQEEQEDFLRAVGEFGRSVEERLGLKSCVKVSEMAKIAREKVSMWREKENDFTADSTYTSAAAVIARSYEHLYYHLSELEND